jgi:acyl-CoA synthetase (AMP-forming)/AMP-acid ligase II
MNFATKGPGQADPAKLVRTIRDHEVGSMFGSPALLANLARYCDERGITLPSVRRIVAGGAEIDGPLYAAVKKVLVDGEMYSNYGATEALPVAEIAGDTVLDETWPRSESGAGVCVGDPLPGVEVRIIAIDDGPIATIDDAVPLPDGSIGEVIARSPHISDRYHEAPGDMVDNKIADGDTRWHRLGDCGHLDDEGRLWVCGRRSHRVAAGARTYFPLCCEPVFNTHPDVARSALIGPRLGAARAGDGHTGGIVPTICVELEPDARARRHQVEADLLELARGHEATQGIERFVFIDRLPVDRRHNAKIDRPALSARFSETS